MKRYACGLVLTLFSLLSFGQSISTTPPDKIYGKLFADVQMNKVFADGKTFVDCIPKRKPADIVAAYEAEKNTPGFLLKKFVEENFDLPANPADSYKTNAAEDVVTHIKNLCPLQGPSGHNDPAPRWSSIPGEPIRWAHPTAHP